MWLVDWFVIGLPLVAGMVDWLGFDWLVLWFLVGWMVDWFVFGCLLG